MEAALEAKLLASSIGAFAVPLRIASRQSQLVENQAAHVYAYQAASGRMGGQSRTANRRQFGRLLGISLQGQ
jgi:hypothetical protein